MASCWARCIRQSWARDILQHQVIICDLSGLHIIYKTPKIYYYNECIIICGILCNNIFASSSSSRAADCHSQQFLYFITSSKLILHISAILLLIITRYHNFNYCRDKELYTRIRYLKWYIYTTHFCIIKSTNSFSIYKDYRGQQLSEKIHYVLIILFGAIAWIVGAKVNIIKFISY
jgi:hypothetical protein